MRLALASANLNIVRETDLSGYLASPLSTAAYVEQYQLTLMAACRALAISLSCSNLGLLPSISGSQNCPTAPFIWPIFPWDGGGALTHCDGSRPTPQTIYAWVSVFGVLCAGFMFRVEGIGCVMRECKDDVRLGMTSELSPWSPRVTGRSRVEGRTNDGWSLNEGAIVISIKQCSAA